MVSKLNDLKKLSQATKKLAVEWCEFIKDTCALSKEAYFPKSVKCKCDDKTFVNLLASLKMGLTSPSSTVVFPGRLTEDQVKTLEDDFEYVVKYSAKTETYTITLRSNG